MVNGLWVNIKNLSTASSAGSQACGDSSSGIGDIANVKLLSRKQEISAKNVDKCRCLLAEIERLS